jgi:ABC-type sugar transport system substrate-binding protein
VPIVSVDGSADAVEIIRAGGTIIATAAQDPRGLATYALRLAERIHAGARPAERTRLLPTSLITSANAASYVPWG